MRAVGIDSWSKALASYDTLLGPGWTHIPAFRSLVALIASSEGVRGLTAITSHETLTVSPYTRYPDWFDGRRVQLHPLADGTVRITRYSEQPPEVTTLPVDQVLENVLPLLADL
jgi:hypothetical protein